MSCHYIFLLYDNDLLLFHHQLVFYIFSMSYLIENFLLLLHSYQTFVKMFFHYFFTVTKLFKHHLNKFISHIFTPVKNNWLAKFIINTNKFISKIARNVILIFFCIKTTCFSMLFTLFKINSKLA